LILNDLSRNKRAMKKNKKNSKGIVSINKGTQFTSDSWHHNEHTMVSPYLQTPNWNDMLYNKRSVQFNVSENSNTFKMARIHDTIREVMIHIEVPVGEVIGSVEENLMEVDGFLRLNYSELYVWLTDLPWLEEQDYIIDMELFNDLIFNINHTSISSKFIVEEFILISFDFV